MNAIYRWFGLILVVPCLFCAGCASHHINLDPAVAQEIQSLKVVSVIPQEEPEAHVRQAQTGGSMFGLLGALVDAGVTSSRNSEADDIIFALRAECTDLDFREIFWSKIENVFEESVWPAEFELTRATEPMDRFDLEDAIVENDKDGFLMISTEYFLTPSMRILVVRTNVELHRESERIREYSGTYAYLSDKMLLDEMLLDDVDDEKNRAAMRWADDHASNFKDQIRQGIFETMRMIQYDLIDRQNQETMTTEQVSFTYEDPDGLTKEKTVKAKLITKVSGRAFLRGEKGSLFSIPESWMVVPDRN